MVEVERHLVEVPKNIPVGQVRNQPYQLWAIHTLNFFLSLADLINGQDRSCNYSWIILLFFLQERPNSFYILLGQRLWSFVVVDFIVDASAIFYVRYHVFGKILGVIVHVLLDLVESEGDWLLDFGHDFLGSLDHCYRELKLCCLHQTFFWHHLLTFFLSVYFPWSLLWCCVKSNGGRVESKRVQEFFFKSFGVQIHLKVGFFTLLHLLWLFKVF